MMTRFEAIGDPGADNQLGSYEQIGELYLEEGALIAADPLTSVVARAKSFQRHFASGQYPIFIFTSERDRCIAFARISITAHKVVQWEMAVKPGQDVHALAAGSFFGYPVNSGYGCFTSLKALLALEQREAELRRSPTYSDYYDEVLLDELDTHNDRWANHFPLRSQPHNMIVFQAGYGDGYYASYWGLDDEGEPVCLLTDFGIITEQDVA